jgi:hypothetical protein
MPGALRLPCLAWLGLTLAAAAGAPAAAQPAPAQQDPDWPCIQVLVPKIAPGQIWTGPPIEATAEAWRENPAIGELAAEIAARRTPLEEAQERVTDFASQLPPERRNEALTQLFAGALETINRDRASLISGIKRFARQQRSLSESIAATNAALRELPEDGGSEAAARRQELQQRRAWEMRIFDEREGSLTYLCEQPVLLERRAFALARHIAGLLS